MLTSILLTCHDLGSFLWGDRVNPSQPAFTKSAPRPTPQGPQDSVLLSVLQAAGLPRGSSFPLHPSDSPNPRVA